jgi:hypothetical protein
MMSRSLDAFDYAQHTAHAWLADLARALDTEVLAVDKPAAQPASGYPSE